MDGGVLHGLPGEETHELSGAASNRFEGGSENELSLDIYSKSGESVDEWLTGDARDTLGVSPLYLNLRYDKCF